MKQLFILYSFMPNAINIDSEQKVISVAFIYSDIEYFGKISTNPKLNVSKDKTIQSNDFVMRKKKTRKMVKYILR